MGYKIRNEDGEVIGRARNGETFSYKVKNSGPTKFYAKTEKESEVLIDIEMGKEYYVGCSIKFGVLVARPDIYEVDRRHGREQFDKLASR